MGFEPTTSGEGAGSTTELSPTPILSYLSSAQQDLTGEPQKNIRKPIIAILTLNSGT